jgi:NADH-quinone oxidoreductase subunit M
MINSVGVFAGVPVLTALIFLPLLGAILLLLTGKVTSSSKATFVKSVALGISLLTFVLSLFIWKEFDASNAGFQFVERYAWLPQWNISYYVGIDGISLFMVVLSTFLLPLCILASWQSIETRIREYMIAFLLLETFMLGMFAALDMVLFYVFFEAVLIPMFLIVGVWGGKNRIYAAFKFFLYTLAGSLLMLLAVIVIYRHAGTADIPVLMDNLRLPAHTQTWLWLAFFAAFAVKVPMVPFHTWLPDAHVEAPTAGSVILAGVLLKMGAFGFLRFSIPMLPQATEQFIPLASWLSIIAVIYTSLIALVQTDMKKLIAYSSIAHMGFVTIGLFTLNLQGMQGAIFQMISHGVVSGALFLCVGVVYDRLHTREIARYGGLVQKMPHYAVVFLFFTMASIGLPATSGFVGEFLVLLGTFKVNTLYASLTALGVVLGAAYALSLYRRVVLGKMVHEDLFKMPDLSVREKAIFAPLIIVVLWMGIAPSTFLKPLEAPLLVLIERHQEALKIEPPLRLTGRLTELFGEKN